MIDVPPGTYKAFLGFIDSSGQYLPGDEMGNPMPLSSVYRILSLLCVLSS